MGSKLKDKIDETVSKARKKVIKAIGKPTINDAGVLSSIKKRKQTQDQIMKEAFTNGYNRKTSD